MPPGTDGCHDTAHFRPEAHPGGPEETGVDVGRPSAGTNHLEGSGNVAAHCTIGDESPFDRPASRRWSSSPVQSDPMRTSIDRDSSGVVQPVGPGRSGARCRSAEPLACLRGPMVVTTLLTLGRKLIMEVLRRQASMWAVLQRVRITGKGVGTSLPIARAETRARSIAPIRDDDPRVRCNRIG